MPLALTSHTWPLAVSWPSMAEGFPSWMRFSATAAAEGWWKGTLSPPPTLKLPQSITARRDAWSTVVWVAPDVMVAYPALTCPPAGRAEAVGGWSAVPSAAETATPARPVLIPIPATPAPAEG
jgi:hypothetical protein